MSVSYTRISNINEKVKEVSLTISQWRVLFAINENTYIEEIGDYVEENIEQIKDSVQTLLNEGLVVSSDAAAQAEEEPQKVIEEVAPEPEPEEVVIEEEEIVEETSEESQPEIVFAEEDPVEEIEEDIIIDESDDDIEIEIEDEDIEIEEDIVIEEPADEPVEEVIEDVSIEEEVIAEESIEVEDEVVEDIAEAPAEPEPSESASSGGKKVMVIDESIVIRKMVEIAFEDLDYNVVGYASGEDALANADSENADLYLIDSALKDVKSVSLMNQLKDKNSSPVIMFCTKTNPQLAKEVEDAGCDGIVSKPFNDDDLISKVNELI